MRTVLSRLHRLENRFVPQRNPKDQLLAELLTDRRHRRLEASAQPFEEMPPPVVPAGTVRYLSSAETMRLCLSQMRERRLQQQKVLGDAK
jgi:hypothetical protein